jgi:hypothetical protein
MLLHQLVNSYVCHVLESDEYVSTYFLVYAQGLGESLPHVSLRGGRGGSQFLFFQQSHGKAFPLQSRQARGTGARQGATTVYCLLSLATSLSLSKEREDLSVRESTRLSPPLSTCRERERERSEA